MWHTLRYTPCMRGTPYGTPVHERYTLWYMPGMGGIHPGIYPGMGGIHPVIPGYGRGTPCIYTTLGMGAGTLPGYIPPYTHPGYTYCCPVPLCRTDRLRCCGTTKPWALRGRNPWVESLSDPKVPKSVRRERTPLRIVTPLLPG